ncbi:MAG: hypothetical protein CFH21_00557 [Alphaproteobacteria bacterium MarineAlpha5_Bin11]|nr:hypothetical protein [Pelagibacteraceae bacterium]PPR44037.1 MAG: hypothetical protein CFH21_00557 [Alphaproteobacteria bacterium MarineAlpha5_Bin11]PPR52008.1 MAG: hypothetical protein CFH20_00196 [Alphaproteobacteria bacterium MarineAlpha5_Bin10]|tara:strand:+ start:18773 stop:19999 length:1227 start_codon:yes stop_codon:yes gene_type:complete
MKNIGIIKESRRDEKRVPLIPSQVKNLINKYSDLKITVQPSSHRCFIDKEYEKMGAIIDNNLDKCDLILGVKEIEPSLLIPSKTYIFFSHTSKIKSDYSAAAQGTPGMDKKELLKEILQKNITLIDYENIRDNQSNRYLGFGRFAGIVGCYNSLNLYLERIGESAMPRAYIEDSFKKIKDNISKKNFDNAKILVTGDGRVAKGVLEFLSFANIDAVEPGEFNSYNKSKSVYCNLPTSLYVKSKNNREFNLQNFIQYPDMYASSLEDYLPYATLLISAHYWDPKSPVLFNKKNVQNYKNLIAIGDITCDINGSIPTTLRSSTIEKPYFYIDRDSLEEVKNDKNSLAIMAVDNLPSELPKNSSEEFGGGMVSEVIPFIIEKDDGRIMNATICSNGKFCRSYEYLNDYINN